MGVLPALRVALPAAIVGGLMGFVLGYQADRAPVSPAVAQPSRAAEEDPSPPATYSRNLVLDEARHELEAPAEAPDRLAPAIRHVLKDSSPRQPEEQGDGSITGVVLNGDNQPVPNVRIIARGGRARTVYERDLTQIGLGEPRPDSLEEYLRKAARAWERSHRSSHEVVSEYDGSFVLSGLPENSEYTLDAFLEGHDVRPVADRCVRPGQHVELRCVRVVEFFLELVGPNGELLETGRIEIGKRSRQRAYKWSRGDAVRLPMDPTTMRALAGSELPHVFPGFLSLTSEPVDLVPLDLEGQSLQLVLSPRRAVYGRVQNLPSVRWPSVYLMADQGSAPDPDNLESSPLRAQTSGSMYCLADVEPDLYWVGLFDHTGLIVLDSVRVGRGVAELDLYAPDPKEDPNRIQIAVTDLDGKPVSDVEMRIWRMEGRKGRGEWLALERDSSEAYWTRLPMAYSQTWPEGVSYRLQVSHSELGSQEVVLEPGQRRVSVTLSVD